jgi:hypothetical protein
VARAGRRDLAAEAIVGPVVDRGIPQGDRSDEVTQLKPRQRRGEQDIDVPTAARRDVGDVPAAEALEQQAELGCLALDAGDGSTAAGPAGVKVERHHPARSAARIVNRNCARLVRRVGGQRPGVLRRIGAAKIF